MENYIWWKNKRYAINIYIETLILFYKLYNIKKGVILENENTSQQICLVDIEHASDNISNWWPTTVVIQCGY